MLPSRALLAAFVIAAAPHTGMPTVARAQPVLAVRVDIVPPPLPVYLQPVIPADGYLWAPGYWDWDPAFGYYWVPGTWVLPPRPNLLWTPGYWGWDDGAYVFHRGYWDTEVGFYGGVDYGYGYGGTGFEGGYWQGPRFFYNRSVTNITNVTITNVYTKTVVAAAASAVSYNGGSGGLAARPSPRQLVIAQQPHVQPTAAQVEQVKQARATPVLRAATNHGAPPIAATPRAAAFHSPAVTAARPSLPSATAGASPRPLPGTPLVPVATPAGGPARDQQPGQHRPSEAERIADPRLKVAPAVPGQPQPKLPGVPPQDVKSQGQAGSQHQEELKRAQEDDTQRRAQQAAEAQQRAILQHQEDLRRAQAADQQKHAQDQAAAAAQRAAAERQQAAVRQQAEAQERLKQQNAQAQQHGEELQRAQAEQQRQQAQHARQAEQQAAQRTETEQQQRRQAEQQHAAPRPEPHPEHPACGHPGEPPCH